jgi:hypothetical protein
MTTRAEHVASFFHRLTARNSGYLRCWAFWTETRFCGSISGSKSMLDSHSGKPVVAGRYTLERRIDTGELGSLWWATDRVTGRPCMLCLVDVPPMGPGEPIRCSSREAMALAQVQCGQVVRMVERGEWQGMPFFVLGLGEEDSEEDSAADPDGTELAIDASRARPRLATRPQFDSFGCVPVERLITPVTVADDSPPSTCRAVIASDHGEDTTPPASIAAPTSGARGRAAWKVVALVAALVAAVILVGSRIGRPRPSPNAPAADSADLRCSASSDVDPGGAGLVGSAAGAEVGPEPSSRPEKAPSRTPVPARARSRDETAPPLPVAPRKRGEVPDYGI